jgi:hypothetical protein
MNHTLPPYKLWLPLFPTVQLSFHTWLMYGNILQVQLVTNGNYQ